MIEGYVCACEQVQCRFSIKFSFPVGPWQATALQRRFSCTTASSLLLEEQSLSNAMPATDAALRRLDRLVDEHVCLYVDCVFSMLTSAGSLYSTHVARTPSLHDYRILRQVPSSSVRLRLDGRSLCLPQSATHASRDSRYIRCAIAPVIDGRLRP